MQAQGQGLAPIDLEDLRIAPTATPPMVTMNTPSPTNTALRPHVLDNAGHQSERRRLSGNNFDDSLGSVGSPDEAVIQARGRRQVPLTFSPDVTNTPLRYNTGLSLVNTMCLLSLYCPLIGPQVSCDLNILASNWSVS